MRRARSVLAAYSEAVQRRIVTVDDLRRAHIEGPPRNSRFGDAALAAERHDLLTVSGLVVMHNSPRRLREHPREVVTQMERCHAKYDGRGLPDGVVVLSVAA